MGRERDAGVSTLWKGRRKAISDDLMRLPVAWNEEAVPDPGFEDEAIPSFEPAAWAVEDSEMSEPASLPAR